MIYDNTTVRRQDRLLDEPRARELLQKGEYGLLSLVDLQGNPYEVSFCVVGRTHVVSDKFTTGYESIVVKCRAQIGLSADERRHALRLFLDKYSPADKEVGLKYAEKSFHRTEIIRLDIQEFSGKQKKVD